MGRFIWLKTPYCYALGGNSLLTPVVADPRRGADMLGETLAQGALWPVADEGVIGVRFAGEGNDPCFGGEWCSPQEVERPAWQE